MTLLLAIANWFTPVAIVEPIDAGYTVNAGDYVLTFSGHFGEVTAIDIPYCDGVKRAYVEAVGWAGWITSEDIAY
jgi:hypothetical protein